MLLSPNLTASHPLALTLASVGLAVALSACGNDNDMPDVPVTPDAPTTLACPTRDVPNPEEQTLPCCYRLSQADQLDAPELRLTFLNIVEPAGSNLAGDLVGPLLNTSIRTELFQWLFRAEGADADGDIAITTGFGRRNATTGNYAFSTGAAPDMPGWAPVTLNGTLTGETISTEPFDGVLTVPIFDESATTVQIELQLTAVRVLSSTLSESRSCIGTLLSPTRYMTGATLGGFVTVASANAGEIMFTGVNATLCGVIAGSLSDGDYCTATPQGDWTVPPDSRCDGNVCFQNGDGGTCDPAIDGVGGCNAWYLEANFAAAGVNIE